MKNAQIEKNNQKIKDLESGVEIKKLEIQGQQKIAQSKMQL